MSPDKNLNLPFILGIRLGETVWFFIDCTDETNINKIYDIINKLVLADAFMAWNENKMPIKISLVLSDKIMHNLLSIKYTDNVKFSTSAILMSLINLHKENEEFVSVDTEYQFSWHSCSINKADSNNLYSTTGVYYPSVKKSLLTNSSNIDVRDMYKMYF